MSSSAIIRPTPGSPYRPGTGLEPPYLGDREVQLERFRGFVAEPQLERNLLVTGLRGVGKTVLLNHYSIEAEAAGWMVVEREFSEADAEPQMFARTLLSDLRQLTRRLSVSARVSAAAAALAEGVNEFVGKLSVTYGEVTVSVGRGHAENESAGRLDDDLREAFLRLGELCRKSGTRGFLLRYDEFHVIRERRGQLTLSALLAATSAAQQKSVPMMLVLCGLPPLLENLVRAKSYSERMFFPEQLGRLEPPEDRAALIDPAVRLGRRFEDEVVDAVMADTEAYPFFIQIFGDGLWSGTEAPVIRWPDYERLRPKILDVLDRSFFEARFLKASPEERKLLRSVAEHGESAATRDLGGRWPNSELQKHLARLTEKGLVFRPQRGFVAFTAPMFGAFLRRRAQ